MIPRTFRFFPWLFLTLTLLAAGCGGGGGGGGGPQNASPILDPISGLPTSIAIGQTLQIPVRAYDPNPGDTVGIFARINNEDKGKIAEGNPATGTLSWTPPAETANTTISITVTATDGLLEVSKTVSLTVTPAEIAANAPPVLAAIGSKTINLNNLLSFTVTASDADNDALTFSVTGLPTGASFNPSTGVFSWTPTSGQAGSYPIEFSVTDGKATVKEQINIAVLNNAPVITITTQPLGPVTENELVTIVISVGDPNGDPITVSASGLAVEGGGVFDPATSTFSWTPAIVTAGTYSVTFAANDGTSLATKTVSIDYVRTNPMLAIDSGLSGITVFNQSISAQDGNKEVFPGQANFWDLDLDGAIFDGFWDQFDGNMFLSVKDTFETEFFPEDQTYAELSFLTPVMTALDGIKVAAVAHHDSYSGPDPRVPIVAVAGEGNYSAWLNTSADSRLQQLVDLTAASAPVTLSVQDEVLALLGEFQDPDNPPYPHYRIVFRDPTSGAILQTLFEPSRTTRNAVELPRATRSFNLDPSVLGRTVLLSFEFRAANGALLNAAGDLIEYLGSYARIDNVSIQDATGEFVQNGDFETGTLTGWSTNAARESQNIRFGQRTLNELVVTRHFYAPPNQYWARWVDVLENNTANTLVKTVNLQTILGARGGAVVYPYPGTATPDIRALSVWDTGAGDRSLRDIDAPFYRDSGLVFGNATSVSYTSVRDPVSEDDDFIDIQHLVIIPPGGRVTLVHFTIMSGESTGKTATGTAARATTIDAERDKILNNFWSDPRYRDGMTQAQIDTIQNFPQGGF